MSDALWTSDELAAATGGTVVGGPFAVSGVSIDSRSIEGGDLFVALAGVRDGHEFAAGALASGASIGTRVLPPHHAAPAAPACEGALAR